MLYYHIKDSTKVEHNTGTAKQLQLQIWGLLIYVGVSIYKNFANTVINKSFLF